MWQDPPADGLERRTLSFGGAEREFYLYRPAQTRGRPAPVVFVFHGGGGRALQMRRTGFEAVAEREGFVVVYPQGVNRNWNDGRDAARVVERTGGADDSGFVGAMITRLVADGVALASRLYATGPSNGGFMSFRAGCDLPVAAIAPQIATMAAAYAPQCRPRRPIGVLMINGDADQLVPYEGGFVSGNPRSGRALSVDASTELWRTLNGCSDAVAKSAWPDNAPTDGTQTILNVWDQCRPGGEVRLMHVQNGGHQWHGPVEAVPSARIRRSGPASRDFIGAEVIWAFFKRFERRSDR